MGAGEPSLENFLPFLIWILWVSTDFTPEFLSKDAETTLGRDQSFIHSKNITESILCAKPQADAGIPQ